MRRIGLGRPLALAQRVDLRFGPDAGRFGLGLRGQFHGCGAGLGLRAMRVGFDVGVDALGFGLRAGFDQLRLTQALGRKLAI